MYEHIHGHLRSLTSGVLCLHMRAKKTTPKRTPRPMTMKGMLITTLASATTLNSFLAESSSMTTLYIDDDDDTDMRMAVGNRS